MLKINLFCCEVYSKENSLSHQIAHETYLKSIHTTTFSPLILKSVNKFYPRNPKRYKREGDGSPGHRAQAHAELTCPLPELAQRCSLSQRAWDSPAQGDSSAPAPPWPPLPPHAPQQPARSAKTTSARSPVSLKELNRKYTKWQEKLEADRFWFIFVYVGVLLKVTHRHYSPSPGSLHPYCTTKR